MLQTGQEHLTYTLDSRVFAVCTYVRAVGERHEIGNSSALRHEWYQQNDLECNKSAAARAYHVMRGRESRDRPRARVPGE